MTLVELMAVIFIIGVMVVAAGLSIGVGDRRGVQDEAARLAAILESCSLQARSSGRSLAWSHGTGDYRFWERDTEGNWRPADGAVEYAPRQLAAGTRITLVQLDGQTVAAGQRLIFALVPSLFQIELGDAETKVRLLGLPSGRVAVEPAVPVTRGTAL